MNIFVSIEKSADFELEVIEDQGRDFTLKDCMHGCHPNSWQVEGKDVEVKVARACI